MHGLLSILTFIMGLLLIAGISKVTNTDVHELVAYVSFYIICKQFTEGMIDE